MRTEVHLVKLVDATKQANVDANRLATMMENSIKSVSTLSPVGAEALGILKHRIFRESVKAQLGGFRIRAASKRGRKTIKEASTDMVPVVAKKTGRKRK